VSGADRDRPPWLRAGLCAVGLLVVYYAVPVRSEASLGRLVLSLSLTLVGVALLGGSIVAQLRRHMRRSQDESVPTLLMLLGLVAVVFALGYYVLNEHSPGQLTGVSTRTDALYFTVATLTTVGYGDVHAEGQVARGLVTLQLLFDVVFVGALVSTVVRILRSRAAAPRTEEVHDATR